MTVLALLLASLAIAHAATRGRVNRDWERHRTSMMRPAGEWTGEDVRRWLALIESFPLPEPEEAAWPR